MSSALETKMAYVDLLRQRPIAINTSDANEQHYEVGTGVLSESLGPRMKYSCCLYPKGGETLAQAEIAMLEMYVERAGLKDGMKIFDLGYVALLKPSPLRDTDAPLISISKTDNTNPTDAAGALSAYTSPKSSPTAKSPPSPTPAHRKSTSTRKPAKTASRTSKSSQATSPPTPSPKPRKKAPTTASSASNSSST